MKKYLIIFLAMVVIGFVLFELADKEEAVVETPTIKIGIILPLTGNSANMGEASLKAINLAYDTATINSKYNYKLMIEDFQLKGNLAATAAQKLISVDKVNAIYSFFSNAGFAVSPIAEKNKIPHISLTWENQIADGNYNFIQCTPREAIIDLFLKTMEKRPDIKTVGIITEVRGGSEELASMLSDALSPNYTVFVEKINRGETNFRMLISKFIDNNVDLYIYVTIPPEVDILAKQLHEAGIDNSKITALSSIDLSKELELHEGISFVSSPSGSPEFISSMNGDTEYGADVSYDVITTFIEAFEANYKEGQIPTSEEIRDHIKNMPSHQCASLSCSIDESGFIKNPAVIKSIKNGKIVEVLE
ncbi:MAG: ABC transporter substrate-binding protein [Lactobacillus sp.]|jgi:branched-chain amino acid transport system substrate-binding protein|nr:ABC transporter substrate-binding protein [Lactobacillus sp.]